MESVSELPVSDAEVDPGVEIPVADWRPLAPERAPAPEVAFVDGVRRVDARVWVLAAGSDDVSVAGLCASYAAGVVVAGARADVRGVERDRALVTSKEVGALQSGVGTYHNLCRPSGDNEALLAGVQTALRDLESKVASDAEAPERLVVLDGPISEQHRRSGIVGYVKSHRVRYLPEALEHVAAALTPGERTPLFATTTSWQRYSCYMKLPGTDTHPWAGVVRLEVSGEHSVDEARELVSIAAASLPRFASTLVADPRAPANLFPIGGLERELRRRLGDAAVVYRALKLAAAS